MGSDVICNFGCICALWGMRAGGGGGTGGGDDGNGGGDGGLSTGRGGPTSEGC